MEPAATISPPSLGSFVTSATLIIVLGRDKKSGPIIAYRAEEETTFVVPWVARLTLMLFHFSSVTKITQAKCSENLCGITLGPNRRLGVGTGLGDNVIRRRQNSQIHVVRIGHMWLGRIVSWLGLSAYSGIWRRRFE